MSRSYKKHPYVCDHKGSYKKRIAWKRVRQWMKDHPDEPLNGGDYKKLYESWDICDYKFTMTWEEYWEQANRLYEYFYSHYGVSKRNRKPDMKEEYRSWYKSYKGK